MRAIPKEELMDTISFVFQHSRLLKGSLLDLSLIHIWTPLVWLCMGWMRRAA